MSKQEPRLPERLSAVGATDLERRLLDAASSEQPPRELSERMARAIGVALPPITSAPSGGADGAGAAAPKGAAASSSLWPWLGGALVAAAVGAGFLLTRGSNHVAVAPGEAHLPAAPTVTSVTLAPSAAANVTESPSKSDAEATPNTPPPPAAQHGRTSANASDLTDQIAALDAARGALATGDANGALALVRKYQTQYPTGAFRPEAAAIKIEALVKAGRTAEAKNLAEKFETSFGAGPLADRVARLAGLSKP